MSKILRHNIGEFNGNSITVIEKRNIDTFSKEQGWWVNVQVGCSYVEVVNDTGTKTISIEAFVRNDADE